MRILFLPRWYPDKNDVQNAIFIRKHAQAVAMHHEVVVLYVTPDNKARHSLATEERMEGQVIEYYFYYKPSSLPFFGKIINVLKYLWFSFRAFQFLSKEKPFDLVHVHMMTRTGVIAYLIKQFWGIKYVITEHWTGYIDHKFAALPFLKKVILKWIIKKASGISVVSPSLRDGMQQLGLQNTYFIIPNVVEALKNIAPHDQIHTSPKKILTVADFYDGKKNISGIVHALGALAKKRSDFELHIIGDGPDRKIIEEAINKYPLLKDKVHLHGRVANQEVLRQMQQTHIYICFSNVETFSVTTAEALAAGKPVICTACGGPEHFVEADMGIILEKDDQNGLQHAVSQLLDHPERFNAEQIKEKMSSMFSKQAVGKAFDQFYQHCTGE